MQVFLFNVIKTFLEVLISAYLPWLDPAAYIDTSRSAVISRRGHFTIIRRIGPIRLPFVWHTGIFSCVRSVLAVVAAITVFILNQAAFDVGHADATIPALVLTCDSTNGTRGLLNNRAGITHLLRTTATCQSHTPHPFSPAWADGRIDTKTGRILYGSRTYRCLRPLNKTILSHANYCYNGNYDGDACTGNLILDRKCNDTFDLQITQSGIEKQGDEILCSSTLNETATLFWTGNPKQGVLITGISEFAPTTLELLRRALEGPPTFLRGQISRSMLAEATVRDRSLCRLTSGRVSSGTKYSILEIKVWWWYVNGILGLLWAVLRWNARMRLDFTATGATDRLRAEAEGAECLAPSAENFLFGVSGGPDGDLHLGPVIGGLRNLVPPKSWHGRRIRGRRIHEKRKIGAWTKYLRRMRTLSEE